MDKDTWIAENLFPKQDNVRKPRLNVKSVDLFNATRKTKFTLCVLGSWAIYTPPYNIARLSSLVREAGYATKVYDFNVESHYSLKEADPRLTDAWNGANYYWWQEPEYYRRIHHTYKPFLLKYLEILLADNPDVIGFSCYYTNILATKWMIDAIKSRRPDITIILGGPECHESNFKKPKGADYIFVGESEQNILDFLNNWEDGIKPTTDFIGGLYSDTRIDIDSLPYPDYSDFDLDKYLGRGSICAEISRGCIAKCSYCTEVYYWKFRDRGALTVVDELEYQVNKYGITFVSFVDSLMNGNLKEFRRFCEEIIKRNIKINWWGYARCDGRMDLSYYQAMADAGCQGFNYGIESGSDKVLKLINKKNTVAEINQNIIDSHKVGMKVSACWVIGAPGEDIEAFTHSFNMLWNHRARIMAVSPGPGLGDNHGSDYDNREKYNLNPRNTSWLGGWFTKDLTNTKLHRQIRIKLMHIWLYICKDYGGTLTNVHSVGNITDHFNLKFNSEYINDHVEYEDFNFNIIQSGQGVFADSVMNEVFGMLRMLWRVRGGYEITINFNQELDHKDFIFAIVPDTNKFDARINFKIDDDGNYQTQSTFKFVNNFRDVVDIPGFQYTFDSTGKWSESAKTKSKKVFFIKQSPILSGELPLAACLSSISVPERFFLTKISKMFTPGSKVLDVDSGFGGRAAILAHTNRELQIHSIELFRPNTLKSELDHIMPWLHNQLVDLCRQVSASSEVATEYLNEIISDFEKDESGRLAWNRITGTFQNIKLHQTEWNDEVDVCLIKNSSLENLSNWIPFIKQHGYLIVHTYNIDTVAQQYINDHCKLLKSAEHLFLYQKL